MAYNVKYMKKYLKNCIANLENPTNKTSLIIKEFN